MLADRPPGPRARWRTYNRPMSADAGAPSGVERPSTRDRRGRPFSIVGLFGELFITAGVLVLLFIAWELWIDDALAAAPLKQQATEQSKRWNEGLTKKALDNPEAKPAPLGPNDPGIPVLGAPENAQRFASLIVPRFGSDFYRPIAQGVGVTDVLNKYLVGHYPSTQMPGAIGNFVLASHRSAYGGALKRLNEVRVGDHVYIETVDGWYLYSFRNLEFVKPTGVGVLDPVPQQSGVAANERMLTLTTCNPFYSTAERIIGYASFDLFYPRAGGPPSEIAQTVPKGE